MPEVNLRQILSADLKRFKIKKLEPTITKFSFFHKSDYFGL